MYCNISAFFFVSVHIVFYALSLLLEIVISCYKYDTSGSEPLEAGRFFG
jgi:hypothetical protein